MVRRIIVREHRRRTRKGLTNVVRHQRNLKKLESYLLSENGIRNMTKKVILTRHKSEYAESKRSIVSSIKKADSVLCDWADDLPAEVYIDFRIIFKDGTTHKGKYPLRRDDFYPNLARHVAEHYRWLRQKIKDVTVLFLE